jgi:para-nitrobenzyl esterase
MQENKGLFQRAAMMSGGGMFPKFALPKKAEDTHEYWDGYMKAAGCSSLEELKKLGKKELMDALEAYKKTRKDNMYNTMPVVDGCLLKAPVDTLIDHPLDLDYMIGYTNTDMYAPVMGWIGNKFGKKNDAYIYFFDIDSPGDNNGAFHSSDLRYMFGKLAESWRPYGERDYEVSGQLMGYMANFARTGDPNGPGLPKWQPCSGGKRRVLCFKPSGTAMGGTPYLRMTRNMLTKGDPKA